MNGINYYKLNYNNMKCMKLGDSIKRVSEKEVNGLLNQGWNFCSKALWKTEVRGTVKKKEVETDAPAKGKQNLKGKAKKLKEGN